MFSFLRRAEDGSFVLIVCNFTPVARSPYRVGVPIPGAYREVVNSDASVYGGSNIGNFGGVLAEQHPSHGRPYSLNLTLPPSLPSFCVPSRSPQPRVDPFLDQIDSRRVVVVERNDQVCVNP